MGIGVIPSKSPAHKQTCLTLYRTLLKETLHLPPNLSKPLLDIIGQRFHLDKRCISPHVIVSALSTARSALTLITSASTGDATSTKTLTTVLSQIEARAKETHKTLIHQHSLRSPPAAGKLRKIAHLTHQNERTWKERIPDSPPILSRPVPQAELPNPSKPRRVPYLTSMHGIPFLRYKSGPQSEALGYTLRSLNEQTMRRWDLYDGLISEIGHGALEDNWDSMIHKFTGIRDDDEVVGNGNGYLGDRHRPEIRTRGGETIIEYDLLRGNKSWTGEVKEALETLRDGLTLTGKKRTDMARQMKEIVVAEQEMADEEKSQRKEIARAKWVARQAKEEKIVAEGSMKEITSAGPKMVKSTDRVQDRRPTDVRVERGMKRGGQPRESSWSPMG